MRIVCISIFGERFEGEASKLDNGSMEEFSMFKLTKRELENRV